MLCQSNRGLAFAPLYTNSKHERAILVETLIYERKRVTTNSGWCCLVGLFVFIWYSVNFPVQCYLEAFLGLEVVNSSYIDTTGCYI